MGRSNVTSQFLRGLVPQHWITKINRHLKMQHICMHDMSGNYLRRYCAYLLGLLAMIKCSICSYQCDNWYDSNMSLWLSHYFSWGSAYLSLLRGLQMLPCALHKARSSSPFGVIKNWRWQNATGLHIQFCLEIKMQT